jgi:2-polyprenyl-6-hydroxyphenyl methylase/3-demethylubiquinone-9 3-methyltransferase
MNLDETAAFFAAHGGTDEIYLRYHWPRFIRTRQEIEATRPLPPGAAVLDIGAHWLHQASIYAHEGTQVTALDLSATLAKPEVISAAQALGIRLLPNDDLEHVPALSVIPNDQFDLVLFTEIIEHITFNPVAMWRDVYRVLKPSGRIVVTTPNYYALRGRLWAPGRFLQRFGGGLDTGSIINLHTHAHHWKEYSMRELIYYFCLLSPDFNCIKTAHLEQYSPEYIGLGSKRFSLIVEKHIPLLRPWLHLEVEMRTKERGIVAEPHW